MPKFQGEVFTILATETFKRLLADNKANIAQLNAAVSLLIKSNVPFVLTFTSGTRSDSPSAVLEISINPNVTVNITFEFDDGNGKMNLGAPL